MNTKQIRQTILDLAIRGELVPQDPTDEPASVLLERIRAEKEQLIKDKKLKRDKKESEPIDEVPFELPEGWEWCRLGEIGEIIGGGTPQTSVEEYWNGEVSWITPADLSNYTDKYITKGRRNITQLGLENSSATLIPKGGILFSTRAPIGYVVIAGKPLSTNQGFKSLYPFIDISKEFVYYFLLAEKERIKLLASGTTFQELSASAFSKILIPLPPLAEQHRIVQKIEQLLTIVDTIEQLQEQLKSDVKQARNQVLNYAIAGKLTHQDPNDEPAEELLKRIGKTTAADTPYEKLPKGWAWCQGNQILNTMKSQKPSGEKFNYIDIASIDNRQNKITEVKTIAVIDAPSRASRKVKFGDTLFSMVRPYLKNIAFVDEEYSNCIASTGFYVCSPNEALFPKYLFYLMVSDYVVQGLNKYMKGDNSPSINNEDITNFIFPLPPLAEQHRIVEKIETFFASFDQIEKGVS